jgi:hypothetical protein
MTDKLTFKTFIESIVDALNIYVVPLILALIFLAFIWGVANYFFLQGANDQARAKGRQLILWGVVGMVVLLGLWGIVNLALSTLNLPMNG